MTEPFSHEDEERVAAIVRAHPARESLGRVVLEAIAPPPSDDDAPTLDTGLEKPSASDDADASDEADEAGSKPKSRDAESPVVSPDAEGADASDDDSSRSDPPAADGDTELGNVLDMLERGPSAPLERALVSGFAVAGYGALSSHDAAWFVRNAERVARDSNFSWFGFVDSLLDTERAAEVWRELALRVVEEEDPFPTARARNAGRVAWLLASKSKAAVTAAASVMASGSDPWIRGLARCPSETGSSVSEPDSVVVRGQIGRPLRRGWMVVRWLTGVALLSWLARGALSLVGSRDTGEVELVSGGVRFRRTTMFLGRVVRHRDITLTTAALASVGREVRYPMIHTLVGLMGLAIGLLAGSVFVVDGVRSGETVLLIIAAVAVALGVGLDLGLDVLIPGHKGLVRVDIAFLPRRVIRLERIPVEDADRFVHALRSRLGRE